MSPRLPSSSYRLSSERPIRVGLVSTLDLNIGDDFIRESIVDLLQRLLPDRRLECVAVDKLEPQTIYPGWHPIRRLYRGGKLEPLSPGVLQQYAEAVLPPLGFSRFEQCDIVVQCGSPIVWENCRDSKWAKLIWRDVLARLAARGTLLLNLGGGAGYPWERRPQTLVGNPDEPFVRVMLDAAHLTTVRDREAHGLLSSLGYDVPLLCCPAFTLSQKFATPARPTNKVIVNFMPGGGMFDWQQGVDREAWRRTMSDVLAALVRRGWQPHLLAHDEYELEVAGRTWPDLPRSRPLERRDYFATIRDAAFVVANRMHACVMAAGLGVPALAIGTDSRLAMVETLGLPVLYTKDATAELILGALDRLSSRREAEAQRLLELREHTLGSYMDCLRPVLAQALRPAR